MVAVGENADATSSPKADFQDGVEQSPAAEKKNAQPATKRQDVANGQPPANLEFILDIPLEVTIELGRTKLLVNDLLKLGQGSVIELAKLAGETLEILANQKLIARGEVVVVNEKYGVRLTEIISPMERVERLK
ncbi:MAG: flagellar motor switch protein FliN [Desulfobacterales bacterium]|nr:MAG: flagellar motor switch protein FliN [Desulfobacterales bacterium]